MRHLLTFWQKLGEGRRTRRLLPRSINSWKVLAYFSDCLHHLMLPNTLLESTFNTTDQTKCCFGFHACLIKVTYSVELFTTFLSYWIALRLGYVLVNWLCLHLRCHLVFWCCPYMGECVMISQDTGKYLSVKVVFE